VQVFLTADPGKEVFTVEPGVIALECIGNELHRYRYSGFLAALEIIGNVYVAGVAEGFREEDVVFARHGYAILPRTGRTRSVLTEESRNTTTGILELRFKTRGVIFGRENMAIMLRSMSEHLICSDLLGGVECIEHPIPPPTASCK
jgi:hypothetical protein